MVVDIEIAPYVLMRCNPIAVPDLIDQHHQMLDQIARLAADRRELAARVLEQLYTLAGEVPDEVRLRVVLPASRAVFNDRDPGMPPDWLADRVPELVAWRDTRSREHALLDDLDELLGRVLIEERERARALLGHEDFARAAAISSPNLARSAARYAATPATQQNKRVRKSEPKLLRYALRAVTKTSPFSHYTVIGMGRWRAGGPRIPLHERVARVEPNLLLLLRLLDAAIGVPRKEGQPAEERPLAEALHLRVADGVIRTPAGYEFEVMRDDPRSRVYRTRRARVRVPASEATRFIVAAVKGQPQTAARLASTLANRAGQPVASAHAFIGRLILAGLLVPDLRVDQQAAAPALRLAEHLTAVGVPSAVELAERVSSLHNHTIGIGALPAPEQPAAIDALRAEWDDAFARYHTQTLTDSPLYEDVALAAPVDIDPARWAGVRADLRRLMPALEPLNMDHPGQSLMTLKVADKLGAGGRCAYPEFVAMLPSIFTAEQITLAAMLAEIGGRDPQLAALLTVRERYLRAVSLGTPQVALEPHMVAGMADAVPQRFRRPHASFSVFTQAVSEQDGVITGAVINAVLDGNGGFMSRFLDLGDATLTDMLRGHVRRMLPAGAAELRPVQGFNANVHPALLQRQFRTFDGVSGLDPARLWVRHDVTIGRLVLEDANGERVHPRYLGFLVPYLLPWELTGLYLLSEPSQLRIDAASELERRLDNETRTQIRAYPRIRFGSLILGRRRWVVPAPLLPTREPAESDARFLARVDAFRAANGMPSRVFFARLSQKPDGGEASALGRPKPMYVDLRSPLHLRCLPAWVADAPTLRIEEALPDPATPLTDPLVGRRTVEYLIECGNTEGGER